MQIIRKKEKFRGPLSDIKLIREKMKEKKELGSYDINMHVLLSICTYTVHIIDRTYCAFSDNFIFLLCTEIEHKK